MTPALPPYAETLGLSVARGADGGLVFTLPFADIVVGRPGFLHGGAIGGLLEIAAIGTLIDSLGDDGRRPRPVDLTVDYMRGGRDRDTHAAARILRLGARIANVEAHAWQDDRERPIAAARLTLTLSGEGTACE